MANFQKHLLPDMRAEIRSVLGPVAKTSGKNAKQIHSVQELNSGLTRVRQRLDALEQGKGTPLANRLLRKLLIEAGDITDFNPEEAAAAT